MGLPIVAIVGRPNVGKSSLLNALVGKQIAIVDPTPGVTRDRIATPCEVGSFENPGYVELVDTGGMGIEDSDNLTDDVEEQITYAVASAGLILFVVDAREGVMPLDSVVARRLRRQNKPVILVANKIDQATMTLETGELNKLGFGQPMQISAKHLLGRAELLEAIGRAIDTTLEAPAHTKMKLAIVGKRNAGKSTFINSIAGQQRVIVSETPGTTRDSVDVDIELDGQSFTLIDTAGLRKRRKISGDIEFYSHHRAMRSIRRADVVAMMIDASVKVSKIDKELAGMVAEQFKPVVLVVNKWDLAKNVAAGEDYQEYFTKMFPELSYAPISLTTAIDGTNVRETIRLAEQLFDQANTRMPTGPLNAVIEDILKLRGPSHKGGTKPPKIFYASQVGTSPPTIVFFVNDTRSFDHNYQRFMLNRLGECTPFTEVPVRLIFRPRKSTDRQHRGNSDTRQTTPRRKDAKAQ